jgi:flagellar motor switch/type III secretory pathway protein FliN
VSETQPIEELTPQAVQEVWAASRAGSLRAGWALSRALRVDARLIVHESALMAASPGSLWAERSICEGPGLVVLMPVSGGAAVLFVSASDEVLPAWIAQPNGLECGRLAALAQELGTSLLPRRVAVRDCAAAGVGSLAGSLKRGECAPDAASVRMSLALADGRTTPALLAWPLQRPEAVFDPVRTLRANAKSLDASAACRGAMQQVKLPVTVVLASKREAVDRIVHLAPGAILRFDKSCQAPLELHVDGQRLAAGQCVEVGRRLGLVITAR